MTMVAYWIIVLIVNGASVPGDVQYPTDKECKAAITMAIGYKASCMPIYQDDEPWKDPAFDCGEGSWQCFKHGRV